MKNSTRIARLVIAGTTALMLSQVPAMAETYAQSGYAAMYANISNGLDLLQVDKSGMKRLSADQLGELAVILDGDMKDSEKKTAAESVFRDSLKPASGTGSEGAVQMKMQVKAQLESIGLQYPESDLTFAQLTKLLDIFATADKSDATDAAAVLSNIEAPTKDNMRNAGAVQLRNQLDNDLISVGIVVPDDMALTFKQVMDLTAIFDRDTSSEAKAMAAKVVLGMS